MELSLGRWKVVDSPAASCHLQYLYHFDLLVSVCGLGRKRTGSNEWKGRESERRRRRESGTKITISNWRIRLREDASRQMIGPRVARSGDEHSATSPADRYAYSRTR